jgi:hypothetical protein
MISRRKFLAQAAGLAAVAAAAGPLRAVVPGPLVTVYKNPTCKCCARWVEHLKLNGFTAEVHDMDSIDAVKDRYGVPQALRGCHTGLVDGYVIEGHVPADDITRLLKERPKVAGLAVPGMPPGSPGMYQPGDPKEPYDVLTFQKSGPTTKYVAH